MLKPFFPGSRAGLSAPPARHVIQAFGFSAAIPTVTGPPECAPVPVVARSSGKRFSPSESARIAVYDEAGSAPRVEELPPADTGQYISLLASRTYELSRAMGGRVPFSVINEVVENYIHADFRGPVVTILDSGNTIRFSDQGPGIKDKVKAAEPGFTTASAEMKRFIRGVGSGLPLVRECLSFNNGTVQVEDNLGSGAVITVRVGASVSSRAISGSGSSPRAADPTFCGLTGQADASVSDISQDSEPAEPLALEPSSYPARNGSSRLTNRQKRVLALVMEAGEAGPSLVAKELAIGLSTAYRDLAHLEALGFIAAGDSGKRSLTAEGSAFLHSLAHPRT